MAEAIVGLVLIGENGCVWQDVFLNQAEQGGAFRISGDQRANAALAFQYADNGGFLFVAGCGLAFDATPDATEIRLIHLYATAFRTTQAYAVILFQHGPNLLEHSPRRFVRDAGLPFDLLG